MSGKAVMRIYCDSNIGELGHLYFCNVIYVMYIFRAALVYTALVYWNLLFTEGQTNFLHFLCTGGRCCGQGSLPKY